MKKARWACDFCEKTQDEVEKIILGPRDIAICNECVDLCVDVISGKVEKVATDRAPDQGAAAQGGEPC